MDERGEILLDKYLVEFSVSGTKPNRRQPYPRVVKDRQKILNHWWTTNGYCLVYGRIPGRELSPIPTLFGKFTFDPDPPWYWHRSSCFFYSWLRFLKLNPGPPPSTVDLLPNLRNSFSDFFLSFLSFQFFDINRGSTILDIKRKNRYQFTKFNNGFIRYLEM